MRALLVAGNDLRRRIRNRSALITAFVGPLAMAIVFSLLIGGAQTASFEIGVVAADRSPTGRELAGALLGEQRDPVRFEAVPDEAAARARVDDGSLGVAIVIPAGFGDAARAGRPAALTVLRSPDRLVSGQVAESVAASLVAHVNQVALTMRTAGTDDPQLAAAAQRRPPALALADLARGGDEASPGAFYGAAMSILFLFFTISFGPRSLLAERRDGTLGRILATPTAPGAVVTGKVVAVGALGLAGFVTVWAVTSLGFGARWGDPAAVFAVIAATVAAVGGVSILICTLARTEQQADAYTATVTFVFALLGGNFVGPGAAPELLRQLSLATPNGWALSAFTDLSTDAATVADVAPALAVLGAIAAVSAAIGFARMHRMVAR
jgi:ABC-2 type transport system permease protein